MSRGEKKQEQKNSLKRKQNGKVGRRLLLFWSGILSQLRGEQGARRQGVQTNLPFIEVITQGNMEHGGKTNNTGRGRHKAKEH